MVADVAGEEAQEVIDTLVEGHAVFFCVSFCVSFSSDWGIKIENWRQAELVVAAVVVV